MLNEKRIQLGNPRGDDVSLSVGTDVNQPSRPIQFDVERRDLTGHVSDGLYSNLTLVQALDVIDALHAVIRTHVTRGS